MRVLIVGCGYVGSTLGSELVGQGHHVWGVQRTARGAAGLAAAGIVPLQADISLPQSCAGLASGFDWVVLCISSRGGGVAEYERTYLQGTRNLIASLLDAPPLKFVYTSSTSVYGQSDASSVDETSPTRPVSPTAKVLLRTEELLSSALCERGFPAMILRVAGIYGPDRSYWLEQVRTNAATLDTVGDRILNMIHRDDVAGAILAALERGKAGEVYNAVDDCPVHQSDFLQWLCDQLGNSCRSGARSEASTVGHRAVTNKRVINRKLREQLGYSFRFPTFREGYLDLLRRRSP
jgi:nucleoside-diphosphate-sugar epimerase